VTFLMASLPDGRSNSMTMNLDLSQSVTLVTGGARSIGRATSFAFARAGSKLVIADLSKEQAQAIAEEICAAGYDAIGIHLDVTDRESVKRCVEEAIRRVGHVDVLVNNAGVFQRRLGMELEDADFNRCLDINLTGIWRMTQALVPHLIARGCGRIINIASIAGRRGLDIAPAYCASKAAVINLTQSLAATLGPHQITVNAVCPGEVSGTAMQENIRALIVGTAFESRLHMQPPPLPLQGPLTAEDVAHAVVFFASDHAKNITGQALNIDRGEIMY
jgi:NAD(P)-dependent dehydrogenase (short-subunit alcohol dehydrogenase family)